MSATGLGAHVTIARTVEEVEALRPAWLELQGQSLTTDPDYFLTVIRADPNVIRPHVVLIEEDGRPAGLVAGRLQWSRLRCRVGYRKLYEPRLRALTVVFGGLLGPLAQTAPDRLLEAASSGLDRREWDVVHVPAIRVDHPLVSHLATESPRWRRSFSEPRLHWRAHLPGSYPEFLASLSSSTRQGVRRQASKLEKEHPEMVVTHVSTDDQLDDFFAAASAVADLTYQRNLGVAVREGDELQRAIITLGMARGWFRAVVLHLEGTPAAFWHGFGYRGIFQTSVPGYDPRHARLNVGTVALTKLVERLCEDESIAALDFGLGDAEYKRRFGDESWSERDAMLFAPSLKGLRVNAVRSTLLAGTRAGGNVLGRVGSADRIKRGWRRRMSGSGQAEGRAQT